MCGWEPDMQVEVIWDDGWGDTPDSPDETTYCEACGRPDHIVITWGDVDEDQEQRRRHEEAMRRLKEGRLDGLSE